MFSRFAHSRSTHLAFPPRSSVEPRGRKCGKQKERASFYAFRKRFPVLFRRQKRTRGKKKKREAKTFLLPPIYLSLLLFPSPPIPVFKTISFFILSSSNSRFWKTRLGNTSVCVEGAKRTPFSRLEEVFFASKNPFVLRPPSPPPPPA